MDVLPLPRCPIRHTFLMVSVSTATDSSSHEPTPSSPRSGHVAYRRKALRAGLPHPQTPQASIVAGRAPSLGRRGMSLSKSSAAVPKQIEKKVGKRCHEAPTTLYDFRDGMPHAVGLQ